MDESNLHAYQNFAVNHIINNPFCGLFLDMGLGKTVSTLTAINRLMYERLEVEKVLVIAPKRVALDTWTTEANKWDHLKHLTLSVLVGTETQRKQGLKKQADIYVINRENISWLVSVLQGWWPFDMMVIDELSSFKSAKAVRFKALRTVRPQCNRVIGLTGTPTGNGLIDLWSEMYLIDMGERLGKTITGYRNMYFRPGRSNGQIVFDYKILDGAEKLITDKISDICISMKAEDYLQLPEQIDRIVDIHLSDVTQKKYDDFERDQILALEAEEGDISAVNAAALSNKLLQYANGAIYDSELNIHNIHDEKLEALEEILDSAAGHPVLVFYSFRHDMYRIQDKFKSYKPRQLDTRQDIKDWNDGKIQLLLAHPASAGHGLNLQSGGNIIVWFGLTWSLELYLQANARLHRQGQQKPVIVHHLIAKGTIDEDVMTAIQNKADKQEAIMGALKARIKKYKKP